MKKIIFSLFILLSMSWAKAQEVKSDAAAILPKFRKSELGFLVNQEYSVKGQQSFMIGFHYKYWISPKIGLRFSGRLGSNEVGYLGIESLSSSQDKIHWLRKDLGVYDIGYGIERQIAVCKYFNLYASLDLLVGYAFGLSQNLLVIGNNQIFTSYQPNLKTLEYNQIFVRMMPILGGKLNFERVGLGTEVSFADFKIYSEQYEKDYRSTHFDAHLFSLLSMRVYMNYRF